jgi:hypothetical protein
MRHRIEGGLALFAAGGLAYLCLAIHEIPIKLLYVVPVLAATGLWMVAFGYPRRSDGLAPGWWRLGLVATAILFLAATFHYVAD